MMDDYERGNADGRREERADSTTFLQAHADGYRTDATGPVRALLQQFARWLVAGEHEGGRMARRPHEDPTAYRDRPPTVEEVRAHSEAHDSGLGGGWWLTLARNGVLDTLELHPADDSLALCAKAFRPCDRFGTPVPWPEVGGE